MRKLAVVAVLASLLCATGVVAAGNREEARKHFDAGLSLLEAEDFEGATTAFEASVRLYPTRMNLFNLANCYKALHRYGESLALLDRLEVEFAGRMGEELEAEVEQMREELENVVAHLELTVAPAGAIIVVDGREMGRAPLAGDLVLGPGEHLIEVTLEGHAPVRRAVRLEPRTRVAVLLELEETAAEEPESLDPTVEQPGPVGRGGFWTGGWVVAGIGAGFLVAGGITGAAALSTGKDLESDFPDGVPRAEKNRVDRMDRLALSTNILLGVGGAAVVAGVVMLLLDDGPAERDVALLPAAGPSFAGATIRGRF